jgi:nucleoside recognition membrane protein YjiH
MSYEERRSIVSLISTILINLVYAVVMLPRFPEVDAYSPEVFKFWASYVLILIPVTVIAKIIIHIVFVIMSAVTTGEYDEEMVDERERLIKLKSAQIAQYLFALGFMLAMVMLVIEQPPTIMFVVLIGAGILTDAASDLTELYYYRRGV